VEAVKIWRRERDEDVVPLASVVETGGGESSKDEGSDENESVFLSSYPLPLRSASTPSTDQVLAFSSFHRPVPELVHYGDESVENSPVVGSPSSLDEPNGNVIELDGKKTTFTIETAEVLLVGET